MLCSEKKPTVIVIGAGISGLSTGTYLQMNGFETRVFEKHLLPGGSCTAWTRKGYIFDYCIDWLIGSGEGSKAHQLWKELGALEGKKINNFDTFNQVIDEQGQILTIYNDPDLLEKHLLEISPIDKKIIQSFCNDYRKFIKTDVYESLKPKPLRTFKDKFEMLMELLPVFRLFWRTATTPMKDFLEQLHSPFLKKTLAYIFFLDVQTFPTLPFFYNMGAAFNKNAGFPEGGSLGLSRSVEQNYLSHGGQVQYASEVKRVLIENEKAIGIELKNGTRHYADLVIAASDTESLLYNILDGKFTDNKIDNLYKNLIHKPGVLSPSLISIYFGVKGELGKEDSHIRSFLLTKNQSSQLPGIIQDCLIVKHRTHYCKSLAPKDHSLVECIYAADFSYWDDLRTQNRSLYKIKKQEVIAFVSEFMENLYPGFLENVEIIEVATPSTMKRYTGNFKGSTFAWKAFSEAEDISDEIVHKRRMQLPGLKNFYMTGQWVQGGGLPRAALSGRYVAQYVCADRKIPFQVLENKKKELLDKKQLFQYVKITRERENEGTVAPPKKEAEAYLSGST